MRAMITFGALCVLALTPAHAPSTAASNPAERACALSWAEPVPVRDVRRWTLGRVTLGFPPGTRLVLSNTGRGRLLTSNGRVIAVRTASSPDGRWLLCNVSDDDGTLFASLTGAQVFTRRSDPGRIAARAPGYWGEGVWMPDGDRWVRVWRSYRGICAVVGRVRDPRWRRVVSLGLPTGTRRNWGDVQCDLVGAVGRDRLLALSGVEAVPHHGGPTLVHLFTFSVAGGSADVRPYQVSLPARSDVMRVALSHGGDQLAWVVGRPVALPTSSYSGQAPDFLMVSRTNGAGQEVVGSFAASPMSSGQELDDLVWSPDGRNVQFRLGRVLWTAGVRGRPAG